MEEWAVVDAKDMQWIVSNTGKIKNPARTSVYTRTRKGVTQTAEVDFSEREIKPFLGKNGYLEVASMQSGRRVKMLVHRLIGMAFVPGYLPDLTVNHINGIKTDNRPENLEWVSLARNSEHEWETGLVDLRGELAPGSKLTTRQVVYMRRLMKQGVSAHALSVIAGVSNRLVCKIRDGEAWKHVSDTAELE
jgi:hypothetical protein